jgi:hypothetical protein
VSSELVTPSGRLADRPGKTVIRWSGVSDSRDPSTHLSPFLFSLIPRLKSREVVIDFRGFEYMSSATVSPLINFVKSLNAEGIPTSLLFDPTVSWQKINAQCLRAIARTLPHVQVP